MIVKTQLQSACMPHVELFHNYTNQPTSNINSYNMYQNNMLYLPMNMFSSTMHNPLWTNNFPMLYAQKESREINEQRLTESDRKFYDKNISIFGKMSKKIQNSMNQNKSEHSH